MFLAIPQANQPWISSFKFLLPQDPSLRAPSIWQSFCQSVPHSPCITPWFLHLVHVWGPLFLIFLTCEPSLHFSYWSSPISTPCFPHAAARTIFLNRNQILSLHGLPMCPVPSLSGLSFAHLPFQSWETRAKPPRFGQLSPSPLGLVQSHFFKIIFWLAIFSLIFI